MLNLSSSVVEGRQRRVRARRAACASCVRRERCGTAHAPRGQLPPCRAHRCLLRLMDSRLRFFQRLSRISAWSSLAVAAARGSDTRTRGRGSVSTLFVGVPGARDTHRHTHSAHACAPQLRLRARAPAVALQDVDGRVQHAVLQPQQQVQVAQAHVGVQQRHLVAQPACVQGRARASQPVLLGGHAACARRVPACTVCRAGTHTRARANTHMRAPTWQWTCPGWRRPWSCPRRPCRT